MFIKWKTIIILFLIKLFADADNLKIAYCWLIDLQWSISMSLIEILMKHLWVQGCCRKQSLKRDLPKGVLPKGVLPKGVLPKRVLPKRVLPKRVLPKGVLPKGVLPKRVLPKRVLPKRVFGPKRVLPKRVLVNFWYLFLTELLIYILQGCLHIYLINKNTL